MCVCVERELIIYAMALYFPSLLKGKGNKLRYFCMANTFR